MKWKVEGWSFDLQKLSWKKREIRFRKQSDDEDDDEGEDGDDLDDDDDDDDAEDEWALGKKGFYGNWFSEQ